jgi:septal ring factor EnvC (AmiA/AmiB activator)
MPLGRQWNMETRLDRIEKAIEALLVGIAEFKESQRKTDAQILDLKESQKKTDEQISRTDAQILDLKESQKKTDEQISRTDAQILDLKESQKKTDEQIRRTDAKLDRVGKQLADQGLVQGEVAEDLFYRNLRSVFRKRKLRFEKVRRNVKKKGEGEFDIVAVDGGRVLVVEVKNKLEKRMVDEFVEERLPRFKELFPEYARLRVEGGMGALVVKDDVGRYAEKAGLYVLTQTDEGGATLLNSEDFEPKAFS